MKVTHYLSFSVIALSAAQSRARNHSLDAEVILSAFLYALQ